MALIALVVGSVGVSTSITPAHALTDTEETTVFKNQIFEKTNAYRGKNNKQYLYGSKHLDKIAQNWANHMAKNNDYRHNPNVMKQTRETPGWTWAGGENIAYGQVDGNAVSVAWWNSPGHKANILFNDYNRIGIGYKKDSSGRKYYVQVFAYNTGADPIIKYSELGKDPKSPFIDVRSSDKFFKEIKWMNDTGVTTGVNTSKGKAYYPKGNVTREAMAAFLYRTANVSGYKPPVKSPFIDVPTNHKFYKEIAWMYSSGLSTGISTSKGKAYSPKSNVTREAMAAFLFRAKGNTVYTPLENRPFIDVNTQHKFYKEIAWMYDNKISTGIKNDYLFYKPKDSVTREAMSAFLYRSK